MSSRPPLRLLVLFQGMWEDDCVEALRTSRDVVLEREGFDSFHWRGVARLLRFDACRWLDRLCETYRGRVDAVWSNDDAFGCLAAAAMSRRLGLPGADPVAIATAQHKLAMRQAVAAALPATEVRAVPLAAPSPRTLRDPRALAAAVAAAGASWPLFCKPVRASFSVLAGRAANATELAARLRLPFWDRTLLRLANKPFAQLAAALRPLPCPTESLLLETPLRGQQINVDGFVLAGDVRVLGVVDECLYPGEVRGARHFAGFTLPSRLPAAVQRRVIDVATSAVRAVGYDHGMFNVELFVTDDGGVELIEINPRSAGQFATLYRAVHGLDLERIAIHMAAGLSPDEVPRVAPTAGAGASFVFRRFDGAPGPMPTAAAREWLASAHPQARLWTEPARGAALRREYRWLGSHRYAVLNHAAADFTALFREGEECARRLFGVALPAGIEALA
jgi:hypothetical protein